MPRPLRLAYVGIIMGACIALDQITKVIAQRTLRFGPMHTFLGDTFRLLYVENPGAMLGFGSAWPDSIRFWFLTVLPGLLLLALLAYLFWHPELNRIQLIALSLIGGGGVSNIIDRILYDGLVVDFMNMGIGDLRTGIFNVADVMIMAGMALMLLFGTWSGQNSGAVSDNGGGPDPAPDTNSRS